MNNQLINLNPATRKVWTPHHVIKGQEVDYRKNNHGIYAHIHETFVVTALEDGSKDDEVLAEIVRR